ncbi:MAG: hypothetical protein QGI09_03535 [Dehalococcoidia bacterium]|nr:hypothetical protein [Dehalococcoidia bacterium]
MTSYDLVVIGPRPGLEISAEAAEMALSVAVIFDTAYHPSLDGRDGFIKVLGDHHTQEILGYHIISTDAYVLAQERATAMHLRLSTDATTQSIYVHPALAEVVQRTFRSLPR